MDKKVVAIYGESASGKSAIKKTVLKKRSDYHEVVTSTTRPMREGEKNGVDYFYYTEDEMREKIFNNEMAECVVFRDWIYGTEYGKLTDDKINIGVWNPEGIETLNDDDGLECLNIYIHTPPKLRLLRSLNREENPDVDEIVRRYLADQKDFREVDVNFTVTVINDGSKTLDRLADEVIALVDRHLGKFV
jgi:guanylate kinase